MFKTERNMNKTLICIFKIKYFFLCKPQSSRKTNQGRLLISLSLEQAGLSGPHRKRALTNV